MINFSKINSKTFVGKAVRIPLKLIPKSAIIPILQGYNKGLKWFKGSGTNGYWLGSYEYPKQKRIHQLCKQNMICWDIGAHVGFYTLQMSRQVGPKGKVIAFEPDAQNIVWLKKHLKINKINNVEIAQFALSNHDGISFFDSQSKSSTSKLTNENSNYLVSVFKGDTLIEKFEFPIPQLIKIDVEGAELKVIKGLKNTLITYKPIIFIVIDDLTIKDQTLTLLKKLNYSCEEIPNMLNEYVCQ